MQDLPSSGDAMFRQVQVPASVEFTVRWFYLVFLIQGRGGGRKQQAELRRLCARGTLSGTDNILSQLLLMKTS